MSTGQTFFADEDTNMSHINDDTLQRFLGQEFVSNLKSLQPAKSDDAWKAIPWMTNIMAARKRSVKEKLPILMWIMVGNPQGCT